MTKKYTISVYPEDWIEFHRLRREHNKQFPDRKVTLRKFFKLCNTYSPMIQSLFSLDPNDSPTQRLGVNTALTLVPLWTRNMAANLPRIKSEHDIKELKGIHKGKSAIVVGAGPSLYDNVSKTNHLEVLASAIDDGLDSIIIITDRVLEPCIRLGIGDYFTVVDGSEIIYQFFDNDAVRKYSGAMEAIIASSAHPKVVDAWKGKTYFLIPSIPQEILPNATRLMCEFTGNSDINAGGNCGMLAWNIATWMGASDIALVGMDMSYKVNTPIEQLQSYPMIVKSIGAENAHKGYWTGKHPFFKTPYRTDQIYQSFIDTALVWFKAFREKGICTTYNCTEGGSVYGEGVECMLLQEFIDKHKV